MPDRPPSVVSPPLDALDIVRPSGIAEVADPETWVAVRELIDVCRGVVLSCASACAAEPDLATCLQRCWDAGDACEVASSLMTRHAPDVALVTSGLQLCVAACRIAADLCSMHADDHEHCRVAAATTARCEQAARDLLEEIDRRGAAA